MRAAPVYQVILIERRESGKADAGVSSLATGAAIGYNLSNDTNARSPMELNDTTDYQRCFVCGQRNPFGLHLVFRVEGDSVVADFQPREEHQGFPGVIHGGIVAAVLDEALGR